MLIFFLTYRLLILEKDYKKEKFQRSHEFKKKPYVTLTAFCNIKWSAERAFAKITFKVFENWA